MFMWIYYLRIFFSMKNLHTMSRLPNNVIIDITPKPFKIFVYTEHTLEPVQEEIDGETPRRSKRQMTKKYFW
jgi:hypothetical protein